MGGWGLGGVAGARVGAGSSYLRCRTAKCLLDSLYQLIEALALLGQCGLMRGAISRGEHCCDPSCCC